MNRPASLIVINHGTPALVGNLLQSLAGHDDRALMAEVILVDNAFPARGDLRETIRPDQYPFPVRFVQNPEPSYASGINRGAGHATGRLIVVANSDLVWPAAPCLAPVVAAMDAHPKVGVAGPQLRFPDGSWQRSYAPFPGLLEAVRAMLFVDVVGGFLASLRPPTRMRRVPYVDGALMVIRRECFDAVSGFDESFRLYAEDCDFCWRAARAGWDRLFVPDGQLIHLRGASTRHVASTAYLPTLYRSKNAFVERHRGPGQVPWYRRLWLLASIEQALVYGVIAGLRRTAPWRWRARSSAAAVAVLWRGTDR